MAAQVLFERTIHAYGFVIPDDLADFPTSPRVGLRLLREEEQAFGFTLLQLTLDQMRAFACDREVVDSLISDVESAFTKDDTAEKAIALVKVDGFWVRNGSIASRDFSKLARERIANIRAGLAAMNSLDGQERDLFYLDALDVLRTALAQVVPYDMILAKATQSFAGRCRDLSAACRDLELFVAKELHLSRPTVRQLCEPFWLSNKLPAVCFGASRYVQSIMPVQAKRDFRFGILERQQRIANVAMATGVPVIELLASWSAFSKQRLRIDRLSGAFASINSGLADKAAREYDFATDYEEVRSAAYQGLTRAISLYAPEKGLKFSTYAVTWIKQTIIRSLIQQDLIRLPEGRYKVLGRVRAVYADIPNASDEYVCSATDVTPSELEDLQPYLLGTTALSMDSWLSTDGEDGAMHDLIADENNDFATTMEEERQAAYVGALIRKTLNEHEYFVLAHRTGLAGAEIIQGAELARRLKTSPQNISRIERKAQAKLACIPELKAAWDLMA